MHGQGSKKTITIQSLKLNGVTKKNISLFALFLLVAVFELSNIWFQYTAMRNVPLSDEMRAIVSFFDGIMSGNFNFSDLLAGSAGHKGFVWIIPEIINVRLFGYNTLINGYMAEFFMLILQLVMLVCYRKHFDRFSNSFYGIALFGLFLFALNNHNHWEITLSINYLPFATRLLSYFLFFWLFDLNVHNIGKRRSIILLLLFAFCVNAIGGGYIVAFIGAIAITLIFAIICTRDRNIIVMTSIFLAVTIVCVAFYMWGLRVDVINHNPGVGSDYQLFSLTNIIKGTLIMFGASLCYFEALSGHALLQYYVLGTGLLIVYVASIVLYIKEKMWKLSYIPVLLISYTFINIALIYYVRVPVFGTAYLASSRYIFDTTLGLIGVLWIAAELVRENKLKHIKSIVTVVCSIFLSLMTVSFIADAIIAPHRGQYNENAQRILLNIDYATDEDLTIFMGNSIEQSREAGMILKKYDLGVFSNKDYYFKKLFNSDEYYPMSGFSSDGWVSENARVLVRTSVEGIIKIHGKYPFELTGNEHLTFTVNGKTLQYKIEQQDFEIVLNTMPNEVIPVEISADFYSTSPPDVRHLAFYLIGIETI